MFCVTFGNLPAFQVSGNENEFQDMLQNIPGEHRQRANRLHDLAHKKATESYMQRYHTTDSKTVSKNSNNFELFNDWSLPYDQNVDKVMFNNHLHTQMNFGVSDFA